MWVWQQGRIPRLQRRGHIEADHQGTAGLVKARSFHAFNGVVTLKPRAPPPSSPCQNSFHAFNGVVTLKLYRAAGGMVGPDTFHAFNGVVTLKHPLGKLHAQ